jgi:hypothetical protein
MLFRNLDTNVLNRVQDEVLLPLPSSAQISMKHNPLICCPFGASCLPYATCFHPSCYSRPPGEALCYFMVRTQFVLLFE